MGSPILRIPPPNSSKAAALCVQTTGDGRTSGEGIVLKADQSLSLDTWFGAFYEALYARHTLIDRVWYSLDLQGRFRITLTRTLADGSSVPLAKETEESDGRHPIRVELPPLQAPQVERGRIGLRIQCLSPRGLWRGGCLLTDSPARRKVALGIILCTYRKETYLRRTLARLLDDRGLAGERLSILVVDNARTLDPAEFSDPRVRLIPNRNLGGSGGFGRGLIEAMQDADLTHFLFMDDDIELDPEAVLRLFPLFAHARGDLAIAGGMLDLLAPERLFEAGARYTPLVSHPLKQGLDLTRASGLNALLEEEPIDYGGFWFFAFSRDLALRIGGVMPYFIKVDDMEFGLRINRTGTPIVTFPGIGVWHEPFYAKTPIWDSYYYTRNNLITNAIHRRLSGPAMLAGLSRRILGRLLLFDYNAVEMLLRGMEDYLRGPDHLRGLDPEEWHRRIVAASRAHGSSREPVESDVRADIEPPPTTWGHRPLALLTLNGHLLPKALSNERGSLDLNDGSGNWAQIRGYGEVRFHNPHTGVFRSRLDRRLGLRLLGRWLGILSRAVRTWNAISTAWEQAAPELRSERFLCKYYGFSPGIRSEERSQDD